MKLRTTLCLLACLGVVSAMPAHAQAPRLDVIWARQTTDPITLDGFLTEPAWAQAESVHVVYRGDNGIPGSGWKDEILGTVSDTMKATLKFLVSGNKLFLGAHVHDKYVGGGPDFNYFDGFLMALKDHSSLGHPAPPAEYTYTWWNYGDIDPSAPGKPPTFVGRWGAWPASTAPRTPEQVAAWNAVTRVDGLSNSDAVLDDGYWVEMVFDLGVMGYHANAPGGDIVEWNISIYDCDKWWPPTAAVTGNRTWWQSPWSNAMWYDEVRIYTNPNVTTTSGPVPPVGPEYYVQNGTSFSAPVIDGQLNDAVWSKVPGFDIRYGDDALRNSYSAVGPYRSGQYQPTVNERVASVLDPGDATVKMFFRGNKLYMGFDVRDQVVQNAFNLFDRWDGFLVTINDRTLLDANDHVLKPHRLTFHLGHNGVPIPEDDLTPLIASGDAQLGVALKPNTTCEDTASSDVDEGYTAELSLDLTKLGYPPGLGDGSLFIGIDLLDGDSFDPFTLSYGTRTWWYREREGECCPASAYMDPSLLVVGVDDGTRTPDRLALLGNAPNPFRLATTIRYNLPSARDVTLEVYDLQGRLIGRHAQGVRSAGEQHAVWARQDVKAGIYMYRLVVVDPTNAANRQTLSGKMLALE